MRELNILVVEDEMHIANLLIANLELEDYNASHVTNLKEAKRLFSLKEYQIVLLDVMLPDGNGVEFCHWLKKEYPNVSVLILSALGQSTDRINGLKAGADDYLGKPFDLEELLLRIKLLAAKYEDFPLVENGITDLGIAKINFNEYTITTNQETYNLTSKEHGLLYYLYKNRGRVISRSEILEHVWEYEVYPTSRTVDNYIVKLRHYIEEDANDPKILATVRGVGYKLNY